ncbi:AraC family transcriptional regulator [Chitinophaga sp. 22620]|uniref:AraC family transcriptional regulator n=1 Tax=Chitinophaga sp. 22620 TaxID=3453952 RepID=UPI003F851CED
MLTLPDIRQLFHPRQPSLRHADNGVQYTELPPHPSLSTFIYCYWELYTTRPLTGPFSYRVVADGCMDIFINAFNPEEAWLAGFSASYSEFMLEREFHYTGIRFLPSAFPLLYGVPASVMTDRVEPLHMLLPGLAKALGARGKPENFDAIFLRELGNANFRVDHRFFSAMDRILQSKGAVQAEQLAEGISARQLRRLFNQYVGESPKTFSKVVRFQQVLQAKPSLESLRRNKIFYDAGYYDQAHFIREFRAMYGLPPNTALR